ncbi:MAG: hypothetical protein AAF843_12705 [Bacteroidota bacterium]
MKNLLFFCCFFLVTGSLSAQCGYFEMVPFDEWEGSGWRWVDSPCPPGDPCHMADCENDEPSGGTGGGPTFCRTNTSILSQTTTACPGGGFVTETVYMKSCIPGDRGTCESGYVTELTISGCEGVELPPEYMASLTTVTCN